MVTWRLLGRPHPSTRGGAAVVTWQTRRLSTDGDMAMVGGRDLA